MEILVTSLVSGSSKMPRVEITVPDGRAQLSHVEAVDLAMNILQCVNAALADAFIFSWAMEKIPGCTEAMAAGMIHEFRDFRDEMDIKERNET